MAEVPHRSIAFAKTTRPVVGAAVPRERLFARLDGTPRAHRRLDLRAAGLGQDHARGELRRGAPPAQPLVPGRSRRRRHGDVLPLPGARGAQARRRQGARLPAFAPRKATTSPPSRAGSSASCFARAKGRSRSCSTTCTQCPRKARCTRCSRPASAQVPKQCCIIVTSRNDPPVALARFRVTGEMVCVGGNELRVEPDELARSRAAARPGARRRRGGATARAHAGMGSRTGADARARQDLGPARRAARRRDAAGGVRLPRRAKSSSASSRPRASSCCASPACRA